MSHGLIVKQSTIDSEQTTTLLNHPFFNTEIYNFKLQDTFIKEQPESEYDLAVLSFLNNERYDYENKLVEYWFQKQNKHGLTPHCDYNFIYREKMKLEGDDWPHKVNHDHIISPITIAVYLEISDDLEGGELCISERTWYEEHEPIAVKKDYIEQFPFETIKPLQGQVLYFHGSQHFHWINPVITGTRKSMLINFWPKELLPL